jgi:biopolymer transport protein TolQ
MPLLLAATGGASFEFVDIVRESKGLLLAVLVLLMLASTWVWVLWVAKYLQLKRLGLAQKKFEEDTRLADGPDELLTIAEQKKSAPGAHVIIELMKQKRQQALSSDFLLAVARRAIADEEKRASSSMAMLSSIASSTPFIGLFGTVYGIMQAFQLIGQEKSASLVVVAPAIGEALIATAVGLMAAIPATIAYNFLDKRIGEISEALSASAEIWAHLIYAFEKKERGR